MRHDAAEHRSARIGRAPLVPGVGPFSVDHEACGVGFVAHRRGVRSHAMTELAVRCLHNLDHRGAKSEDGTGDGAGVMIRLPERLLCDELDRRGIAPPPPERLGVLMTFLPLDRAASCRQAVERALAYEDISVLAWRPVPVAPEVLGLRARMTMPRIEQALVAAGPEVGDERDFERRLLLARKHADRVIDRAGIDGFYVASSSGRTVVYKGLFTALNIANFYPDLTDPRVETDFAVFHQRYSTNTSPSWSLAQPLRILAHNGEINTVRANRAWMAAHEADFSAPLWGRRAVDLRPFMRAGKSDSGSLDNAAELLVRTGRSLEHVKEMLIPAAWENVSDLDEAIRAFREYHAFLTEPWDGPAAVAASDGVTVLAGMDRNGLRPARWTVTPDLVVVASEAGVAPEEEAAADVTGQLGPGETISVDLASGEVRFSDQILTELAARRPYAEWITTQTQYVQHPFDDLQDDRFDAGALARVFGYTVEERRLILGPMAEGRQPVGSMGNDTPLAVLSQQPQRLTRFFHQMFAQVTNPPMDPIRERLVMSTRTYLGHHGSILEETAQQAHLIELASPILADADLERIVSTGDDAFRVAWLETLFPAGSGGSGLAQAVAELVRTAEHAVRDGATILVLSDRGTDEQRAPIPMLLATGAVHHHLIDAGLRLHASIVVVSGEARDAHDIACLVAYGAAAVNPYLAIEQVRALGAEGGVEVGSVEAQENYRSQLESGLLKVMSKMGICTLAGYQGSELYEAIGLDDEVRELAFRFTPWRVSGIGLEELAAGVARLHERYSHGAEDPGGYYKHRRGGVPHVTTPSVVLSLQKAVRAGSPELWDAYVDKVQAERAPAQLRDLLELSGATPIPLDEVEGEEEIVRRFTTAAMSLGALGREAHEALAEAMNRIGGMSNSGEGGEDPRRFGGPRNSAIKQVASGRFGVTPDYLASASELQIKMAQGSKPGEGGQLPGNKVTAEIAELRHTEPGVTLISPPPHHDIYSIEDLAQLIYDLKTFNREARVSVKLVSEPGVGVVAVGVAKAQADVILISGNEGGTGASPLTSVKHAGSPWELGLAEAHQALTSAGLREQVFLEADGGMRTGRDIVVAALLGADRFGFGTLPLLAMGCKMVRQCHENTCPVGIATQAEDLRAKFSGSVDHVVQLFMLLAGEVRRHLAALGFRRLGEAIGRADLLTPAAAAGRLGASLQELLVPMSVLAIPEGPRPIEPSPLGEELAAWGSAGGGGRFTATIANTDRTVGARLSAVAGGGERKLVELTGTAGQSFAAFLSAGIEMRLDGVANDYMGKGMGGGVVAVRPPAVGSGATPQAAGNAILYGATGGEMYVAGRVGQRFAVRNSGARVVVEGCGDHGCEYMTGGAAVVLGPVGRNLGAGMTGGVVYVWDPDGVAPRHVAETAPRAVRASGGEVDEIRELLEQHRDRTGSELAARLLDDWPAASGDFWVLRPEINGAQPDRNLRVVAGSGRESGT